MSETNPVTKGLQTNEILFFRKQGFSSLGEKTSAAGLFVGVQGEIFYLFSEADNSDYIIEIKFDKDLSWVSLIEGTVKAGILTIIDVDFFIPAARIKVTPKSTAVVFTAKTFGYPAVFIRGPGDPVC